MVLFEGELASAAQRCQVRDGCGWHYFRETLPGRQPSLLGLPRQLQFQLGSSPDEGQCRSCLTLSVSDLTYMRTLSEKLQLGMSLP